MAEEIQPLIEESGVEIEQFLVEEGTEPTSDPTMPALLIGTCKKRTIPSVISSVYTGSIVEAVVPNFEIQSVILEDTLSVELTDIKISLLNSINKGSVAISGDDSILTITDGTNPIAGQAKGIVLGDAVELRQRVIASAAGTVLITDRYKLTDSNVTLFVGVVPGDILVVGDQVSYGNNVWNTAVASSIKEYTVTEVGANGAYVKTDNPLDVNSGISFNVVRPTSTVVVSSAPVDVAASQILVEAALIAGTVEFKVKRSLVDTGVLTPDQPVVSKVLDNTNYSIISLIDTKDAVKIDANLSVEGFGNLPLTFPGTGSLVVATNPNLLIVAGQNLTTGSNPVGAGDTIYFNNTSNQAVGATVQSVVFNVANTEITLVQAQTVDVTAATVTGSYKGTNGATVAINQASIKIGYTARSTKDANRLLKIEKTDDLDQLGEDLPYNPLRVAARLCKGAAGDNAIYVIIAEDESIESYSRAFEMAEGSVLYTVVPLSQSIAVASEAKIHVDAMSTPKNAKWRVCFINLPQPVEGVVVNKRPSGLLNLNVTVTGTAPNVEIQNTSKVTLTDNSNNLSAVFAGMYLKVYEQLGVANTLPQTGGSLVNDDSYETADAVTKYLRIYKVKARISNTKLELEPLPYTGSNGIYTQKDVNSLYPEAGVTYLVNYEVLEVLNFDQRSQAIGRMAQSFGNRRVNYVPQTKCDVPFVDADGVERLELMSGLMILASLAGLISNTEPHQPMTKITIPGIRNVYEAKDMYSAKQLSVQATGGCWIVAQEKGGLPYTWRQLTTSSVGVKHREFSVTKNVDEISMGLYTDLGNIPGRNNKYPKTIAKADQQIIATLNNRTAEVPGFDDSDIGPQILSYSTEGTIEDPFLLDTLRNKIKVEVPLPVNKMIVSLYA